MSKKVTRMHKITNISAEEIIISMENFRHALESIVGDILLQLMEVKVLSAALLTSLTSVMVPSRIRCIQTGAYLFM